MGLFLYFVAGEGFEPPTFRFWLLAAITGSVGLSHQPELGLAKSDASIIVSEPSLGFGHQELGCGLPL